MSVEDILDRMVRIAEKHSKHAEENPNLDQTLKSLKIVKQSIEVAFLLQSKPTAGLQPILIVEAFMSIVKAKAKRADCFVAYLDVCEVNGLIPCRKSEFYSAFSKAGFNFHISDGDFNVIQIGRAHV